MGFAFEPNFRVDTDFLIFNMPFLYDTYGPHKYINLDISTFDSPNITFVSNKTNSMIKLFLPLELGILVNDTSTKQEIEALVLDLNFELNIKINVDNDTITPEF